MQIFKCRVCDREYLKSQSLGAHVPKCKNNPNYETNMIKAKSSEGKSNSHTEESRIKLSQARKKYIAEGGRILNGKGGNYQGIDYKSSWELMFAIYCDLAGIGFEYESQKAYSYKTWVADFEVDGELYEVGWHDHAESIEAFEADGWICNLFRAEEIDLIRSFIPKNVIKKYNLPKIDLKANRDKIKTFVPTIKAAEKIAESHIGRTLKAKEVIWFKDNDFNNLKWENIIVFKNTSDCKIFRDNYKSKKYILFESNEKYIYNCKKKIYKLICLNCNKEFTNKDSNRKYCTPECSHKHGSFPWPPKEELEELVNSMSMLKVAEHLREVTGKHVSDNGVRKHCKKLGIEIKGRGYWGKKENGFAAICGVDIC